MVRKDGEERGFQDAVEHISIVYGIKWKIFRRGRKRWSSDVGLHWHGKII
jgi:hypothetical protein